VIFICKKVLETPRTIFDSVNLPRFNAFLGNAYLGKGDFQNANICYIEALRLAEMMHDEPLAGVCLGNLSVINSELRNYRDAIKYQRRAADIAQKNNQVQQLGTVYLAMGTSYRELMALDSAIYYYRKSLELSRQFGLIDDIAICHSNLGAILVSTNQLDSGLYYMQLAKTEFASQSDSLDVASNALTMGWVWRALAFVKNNKSYLQNARSELLLCKSIAEQKDISDLRMKCYKELSVLEETMGHPVQAFEYLKQYSAISDSTRGQQYTKQIAEMQTQYQSEKKELEITKLNTEKQLGIEKIARQRVLNFSLLSIAGLLLISGSFIYRNIQKKRVAEQHVALLEKQNAIESMRSKIASDVHDEMGANLTRLGLNAQQLLQSPAIPENEKLLAEKMASQSKDILTGMREIIWASNPANDNLKSMLGFMRQFIDRFFDGTQIRPVVNFPHNIGEVTLHPEVRRNLFLILKESLNNALKYSGSDRIDIDFHNENENYQLTIKDYGKGLEDEEKNDFSSGLHNMQMRAEQIKSFFRLLTGPG
ncbi:MAG TPA: tetratricopeptide repeat protein, partial [Saprospiraceae bacterium]|nr:tetratricopeptide repeat protein [Saprospiraceae bacterium]